MTIVWENSVWLLRIRLHVYVCVCDNLLRDVNQIDQFTFTNTHFVYIVINIYNHRKKSPSSHVFEWSACLECVLTQNHIRSQSYITSYTHTIYTIHTIPLTHYIHFTHNQRETEIYHLLLVCLDSYAIRCSLTLMYHLVEFFVVCFMSSCTKRRILFLSEFEFHLR